MERHWKRFEALKTKAEMDAFLVELMWDFTMQHQSGICDTYLRETFGVGGWWRRRLRAAISIYEGE